MKGFGLNWVTLQYFNQLNNYIFTGERGEWGVSLTLAPTIILSRIKNSQQRDSELLSFILSIFGESLLCWVVGMVAVGKIYYIS